MRTHSSWSPKTLISFLAAAVVAAIGFAALWLNERRDEKGEKAATELGFQFVAALTEKSEKSVFKNIEKVSVQVYLNDAVKKIVPEDRVKTKFELTLRKNGVLLDEKALHSLIVSIEGLWDKNEVQLTYTPSIALRELAIVTRKQTMQRVFADVWREGSYGYAGRSVVEKEILESVEQMAESFANKLLSAQHESKK